MVEDAVEWEVRSGMVVGDEIIREAVVGDAVAGGAAVEKSQRVFSGSGARQTPSHNAMFPV